MIEASIEDWSWRGFLKGGMNKEKKGAHLKSEVLKRNNIFALPFVAKEKCETLVFD